MTREYGDAGTYGVLFAQDSIMSVSPPASRKFKVNNYKDDSDLNSVIKENRKFNAKIAAQEMREKKEREFIEKVMKDMESESKVAKKLESYCEELERNRSLRPNERAM